MVCTACVVAAALVWSAAGLLAPPQKNYSILMLIPYWGKSHRNVFMPLSEALADRGHKVVMLTMVPESSTHPNITEVSFSLANVNVDSSNMFDLLGTSIRTTYMPIIAREMYKLPCVKKLYKERKQFDLIVVDYSFSQVVFPFVHEVFYITVATVGNEPFLSAVMGNVLNPSYAPSLWSSYVGHLSFWERMHNMVQHVWPSILWKHWNFIPDVQREVIKRLTRKAKSNYELKVASRAKTGSKGFFSGKEDEKLRKNIGPSKAAAGELIIKQEIPNNEQIFRAEENEELIDILITKETRSPYFEISMLITKFGFPLPSLTILVN
ncbi:hypothetical protein E2C01_044710 [Portunus trituberculatus]|uniref:Ecdysteroid UDP-glucosyltransferase n=1 Tax=Portunus trituberculatus TaxID=210409 RepID=A0A5B7FZ33_PORTR|nr:hypothetical protein [Portunus trituberculatus]